MMPPVKLTETTVSLILLAPK